MNQPIRLMVPTIEEDDIQAVVDVLRSKYLVQGPKVLEFERDFAAYVGTKHAVATINCTEGLLLSLLALGIGPGDKVAVGTFSWPASANCIVLAGATPVFVDIEERSFNIDPQRLSDAIAKDASIKAVIPVHTFGGAADIEAIRRVTDPRGIPVVEDAACALGTEQNGRRAGSLGRVGVFSLHPRKAITTGEGGMMTTDDDSIDRTLRIMRNHGQELNTKVPDFIAAGHNLRMTEMAAAMGITQLRKFDLILAFRAEKVAVYKRLLEGTGIRPPMSISNSRHVYQSYVVLVPREAASKRTAAIEAMKAEGIEVTIGTYHIPLTTYFKEKMGCKPGDYPVTDDIYARAMTLPVHETLTVADQERVVSRLKHHLGI